MGFCARCGASVIDDNSYRKAYCNVLQESVKNRQLLKGFFALFDKHLFYNPQTQEYNLAPFDRVEAVLLGIEQALGKKEENVRHK